MDNHKLLLTIGILLTAFLLWERFEVYRQKPAENQMMVAGGQNPEIPNIVPATQNAEIPNIVPARNAADIPKIEIAAPTQNFATAEDEKITVETDVLAVEISTRGGTVESAKLKNYPLTRDGAEKFQLLRNDEIGVAIAQNGLISDTIDAPTHHDIFITEKSYYDLGANDELVVPLRWQKNGVEIVKIYTFRRADYLVDVHHEIKNLSEKPISIGNYAQLTRDGTDESSLIMPTFTGGAFYNDENIYEKLNFDDFDEREKTRSRGGWLAMVEHYFFSAWIPDPDARHGFSSKSYDGKYLLSVVNPAQIIAPGETKILPPNRLYIGPKALGSIEKIAPGLDKTIDYGVLFIIAKPLSEVLFWIHKHIQSWGWAIIVLTILIKLVFYPLSEKSYRSMAGMKKLAPRIQRMKESYGDDRKQLAQKTMELYRREKINPASGCLPILIQIPVFIALYWVLLEMVELRQTPFWYLPDLSAKDPYFVLPIVMGLSMFVQQKLNPPPPDPMQAKIMMSLPIVFTFLFLWFPSGLVLYWVVNNILSIAQQWFINRRINRVDSQKS